MNVLVVIPARGGSKGVLKKNIKPLGDRPLIAHAISCAKKSKKASRVIISTDSSEIAEIAESYGGEVILRPVELAEDSSNVVSAVLHVYQELHEDFDIIVLLQPTSPLRTGKDLDNIISIFEENENLEGVISVVPMYDLHPARMYNIDATYNLIPFVEHGETSRRQDLEPVYYRNGCFYAVTVKSFLEQKSFMVKNKKAYIMNAEWLVNIDDPRDFKIATLLYEEWKDENFSN